MFLSDSCRDTHWFAQHSIQSFFFGCAQDVPRGCAAISVLCPMAMQYWPAARSLFSDSLGSELNEKLCLSVILIHPRAPPVRAMTEFKMLHPPVHLSADSNIDLPLNL